MVTQTLQQALEQLYGLERRRDKLGLDGTRALLGALGHPERRFRAVHVAGTNGKGSVCALIERVLRAAGARTGLFTSPHLVDFRERIRVAGRWADEAWLFETLRRIEGLPGGRERTFFEVATGLGFAWFAASNVEWGVIEVGLGGRLDTTNVVEPALCVITGIGLDHTEILGDTIEKIAAEKAGIVKPGVPVVTGAGLDPRARTVIAALARERGAPLVETGGDWRSADALERWLPRFDSPWGRLDPLATAGGFDPRNVATALASLAVLRRAGLAIPREAVREGFRAARWPGRFERCPREPRLLWDGAHNAEGAEALAAAWRRAGLGVPAAIVLALSRDKPLEAVLDPLAPLLDGSPLLATRSRNERAMDPERISAAAISRGLHARVVPSVAAACARALERVGPGPVGARAPALLTGSLFAVGEAMEALGGAPGELL